MLQQLHWSSRVAEPSLPVGLAHHGTCMHISAVCCSPTYECELLQCRLQLVQFLCGATPSCLRLSPLPGVTAAAAGATVVGVLLRQGVPRHSVRIGQRFRAISHELESAGLGVARVPITASDELLQVAAGLCAADEWDVEEIDAQEMEDVAEEEEMGEEMGEDEEGGMPMEEPQWPRPGLPELEDGEFIRVNGAGGTFPDSMLWYHAADQDALELFHPCADAINLQLGGGLCLVTGAFVMVKGGCKEGETAFHVDMAAQDIPTCASISVLFPIHPSIFPEHEGNLEWIPWDADGKVAVHRYIKGRAAVFDGKLAHRTQPFSSQAFHEQDAGLNPRFAVPLRGTRVLAYLTLARLLPGVPPWRQALHEVLWRQGVPALTPLRCSLA